jgi:hypothetical protein
VVQVGDHHFLGTLPGHGLARRRASGLLRAAGWSVLANAEWLFTFVVAE